MTNKRKLSLRELKFAKTRLKTMEVFIELIKEKSFDKVTIEEVCYNAEISKGTFFNHFPSKEHIYTYYGWNFCTRLIKNLDRNCENLSSVEKIKYIFNFTIEEEKKYSGMFNLYISHILRRKREVIKELKFTKSDLLYIYPNVEKYRGTTDISIPVVSDIFEQILKEGINNNEFNSELDVKKTILMLLSVYLSPPISYKFIREDYNLEEFYNYFLNDILCMIVR